MLQGKSGKNLFIYGAPGIGKTAAMRFVLNELEEETEEVVPIYIKLLAEEHYIQDNCGECARSWGYRMTHNKRTEELFAVVKNILNKKAAVFDL